MRPEYHCGLVYIKTGTEKNYIALLTCIVARTILLEISFNGEFLKATYLKFSLKEMELGRNLTLPRLYGGMDHLRE